MAIAGHLSRRMLEHYLHIRVDAKRKALDSIVTKTVTKSEGKAGKVSNLLKTLAGTTGLEPATSCVTAIRLLSIPSIHFHVLHGLTPIRGICFRSKEDSL